MIREDGKSIGRIEEYFLEEKTHELGPKGWLTSSGARYGKNHRMTVTAGIYQVPAKHQALCQALYLPYLI